MQSLKPRFFSFLAEQFPFVVSQLENKLHVSNKNKTLAELKDLLQPPNTNLPETTPFVEATDRFNFEKVRLLESVQGFFDREALRNKLTNKDRLTFLRGMILTRAADNQMKKLFLSGEVKFEKKSHQGKGFRSLGQEAIFAAAWGLKHGKQFQKNDSFTGDVIAPMIRDLGLVLAYTDDVEMVINAQFGKVGKPSSGHDLHVGDLTKGVIYAAAPLAIGNCTAMGSALAFKQQKNKRIAVGITGDGGCSMGEWHEAINMAATLSLPMFFCVQNNQTALSTPVEQQSRVRTFAEKAQGYGLPFLTVDGNNPEDVAVSFAWAAKRARSGLGPTLVELVTMRLCGHAHHDDMLYLGKEPQVSFEIPTLEVNGYVDKYKYNAWKKREPLKSYAEKLVREKICTRKDVDNFKQAAVERCESAALQVIKKAWPQTLRRVLSVSQPEPFLKQPSLKQLEATKNAKPTWLKVEDAPDFSPKGATFLEAIGLGTKDVFESDKNTYVIGEDVAPPYGNAFMMFKKLMALFPDRFINTPIAEGAIIGACVGMALEGLRPIGEMQFNDFVACGFNQLVNNAAYFRFRTEKNLPLVLRMPWGGLRHAGPYHSQDTSAWFYRVPGLKIVVPSTPYDARALLNAAVNDPDPVLFYEHITLYRDPRIRQILKEKPGKIEIGKAALRKEGKDLSLISYGAFVHKALACALKLELEDAVSCDVLDLRSLSPLDFDAVLATTKRTGRVLLVGEDTKNGGVLESLASRISESAFTFLDAPVRVLGSLSTPIPYAPTLERKYLVSDEFLLQSARELLSW